MKKIENKFWLIILGLGYASHLVLFYTLLKSMPSFVIIMRWNTYSEVWIEVVIMSIVVLLYPVALWKLFK